MSKPITISITKGGIFNDMVLAKVCAKCGGSGAGDLIPGCHDIRYQCIICEGAGYELTDNGRAILALINSFSGTRWLEIKYPRDSGHS